MFLQNIRNHLHDYMVSSQLYCYENIKTQMSKTDVSNPPDVDCHLINCPQLLVIKVIKEISNKYLHIQWINIKLLYRSYICLKMLVLLCFFMISVI